MARRRLHGTTQKRRKKRSTQVLKRQDTVARVQSTQRPAPFQRTGELEGQDIAFLEAMRAMGVKRYRRPGETPVRAENFERVHFAMEQEQQDDFAAAMDSLGVKPLPGQARKPGRPSASARTPDPAPAVAASMPGETPQAETNRAAPEAASGRSKTSAPAAKKASAPPRKPRGAAPGTRFQWDAGDLALLAETLRKGDFDPAAKFEGAPEPPPPPVQRRTPEESDPDGELDLHGKTQEEAIRMVQNFLLTSCQQKLRDVLIITGKGLNSGEHGPVLRDAVYRWLQRNGARFAKGFTRAPARLGGDGAIWVTLR